MGKTFVYNTGNAKPPIDEIHLEIGVFFDGTLNSLNNTQLREKYRDGKNKILRTDSEDKMLEKEEAIKETRKKQEEEFENLKDDDNSEYAQYLRGSHRGWLDSQGVDNSYSNDSTNVARMYKSCEQYKYGVYVEGIGTMDNDRDVDDGFQYGSGKTGVRGKVRRGCEMVATRINSLLPGGSSKKKMVRITIDTFGFSRGAAAARNFAYEINGNKRAQDIEIKKSRKVVGYKESGSYGNDALVAEYEDIWLDKDKTEVDPKYLVDGKLPKFGFLGYYLLSKKILSVQQLEDLELEVRFIGVYETVSSYEEFGDMGTMERVGYRGILHASLGSARNFADDVEQLQLRNPGPFRKAVHFTAENEHRENFSLTTFTSKGVKEPKDNKHVIEKEFPGVHCDIGGAYENGTEEVDEIETSNHKSFGALQERRQQLIDEHWFTPSQITMHNTALNILSFGSAYRKIRGVRFLRKEYSYIPLQFMEKLGEGIYDHQLMTKIVNDYPIAHDKNLVEAEKILNKYVFGNGEPWSFISDAELKKENERLAANDPVESPTVTIENEHPVMNIPEVRLHVNPSQNLLRTIRNKYLHWSANRDWMGMDPNSDYQRRVY
ncbi:MAG: phospholipase effector Tle1 domain-containing protein [Chryseobacterium jejuense]|uniref:phospholipase effector Tle1 domain-containing protein n=1 Tax=Chryseobacterium jejuense TaxID=445960 RepID=UPI003D14EFC1